MMMNRDSTLEVHTNIKSKRLIETNEPFIGVFKHLRVL
jgi:hypothetical protein